MIQIVGGTYDEFCFEPNWKQRYGSGVRACCVINKLSLETAIEFHTFCDQKTVQYFDQLSFISLKPMIIDTTMRFYYDHPLSDPSIAPRLDTIDRSKNNINVEGENILFYGLLEGFCSVKGENVVYDPQSPINPLPFSKTNSKASNLAYVINIREARIISGKTIIDDIITYFFEIEKVTVLVLKMGAKGAIVAESKNKKTSIPVYKTDAVWPIGSGDVFAAVFAYHWFIDKNSIKAAQEASWQTACYCSTSRIEFSQIGSIPTISPLTLYDYPKGQIYLAGPFFTFSERWLVDQIRAALLGFQLNVFSPWHDVGHGVASEVVSKDLAALENSTVVFAVLDGLDSGTLFEIGFAIKSNIPVIGYVENESIESVKMLEGTNCILEKDLTTAIYKCFWKAAEIENV